MTKTAKYISDVSEKFRGKAFLYKVFPPLALHNNVSEYVVSSAVNLDVGLGFMSANECETYIFAATINGDVISYMQLPGSTRGIYDPEQAIRNAGYEIITAIPA